MRFSEATTSGDTTVNARSPFAQLIVVVLILIAINVIARVLGLNIRISIIGSIVLTLIVGGVMGLTRKR